MIVGRIEDVKLTSRIGYQKVYEPTVRALTVFNGSILGEVGENEANLLLDELLATLARGEADVVHMPHMVAEDPCSTRHVAVRTSSPGNMVCACNAAGISSFLNRWRSSWTRSHLMRARKCDISRVDWSASTARR